LPLPGKPLEPRELARLCHKAGWRDYELVTAVAVCLSESAGYPLAYHDNEGDKPSRDVGLFQINIPYEKVGTDYEQALYEVTVNIDRARALFLDRYWQPWYGYTNGYAMSTKWYRPDGKPSGRYLMKAIRGVGNFYAEHFKVEPAPLFPKLRAPKQSSPPSKKDERR
jgi:hypothetical protein